MFKLVNKRTAVRYVIHHALEDLCELLWEARAAGHHEQMTAIVMDEFGRGKPRDVPIRKDATHHLDRS